MLSGLGGSVFGSSVRALRCSASGCSGSVPMLRGAALAALAGVAAAAARRPSTIVTLLIDDLGSYDTAVNNEGIEWLTPNLKQLSHAEGLRLDRFYLFK